MAKPLTPIEAVDALLGAAERAQDGYADLVLTGLAASITVQEAPMDVATIRVTRDKLRQAYANDPGGVASRLLGPLNAVFEAVRGVVA